SALRSPLRVPAQSRCPRRAVTRRSARSGSGALRGASEDGDERFGLSVFLRDGDDVFRTYFTSARGVDRLRADFNLLDLTPLGRQETWEDSPEGWPQTPPYAWWRLHDEYEGAAAPGASL